MAEALPKSKERQALLVDVRPPSRTISDILLNEKTKQQLVRILEEYRKSEVLRVHGLRPKTKLLFCGPPGCGKTLCAEVIASEMQLSLLYTRFDGDYFFIPWGDCFESSSGIRLREIWDLGCIVR